MKNKQVNYKLNLILHSIMLALSAVNAILNDETVIRLLWTVCAVIWLVLLGVDLRGLRREKKEKSEE